MKPLAGITVVDFTHMIAGPFATQVLGDLGASVIKVEDPDHGDVTRNMPPFVNGQSHYFLTFNRNKQSIAVNIKTAQGRAIVDALLDRADVLVENFAPGVMARLGLDQASLQPRFPRLVYCSISGFGKTGPLAGKRSYDLIAQAFSGVMSVNGESDSPPLKVGIPIGDTVSSLFAVIGVLAALLQRKAGGPAAQLDISLHDCLITLLANHAGYYLATGRQAERTGSHHYMSFPNGSYRVSDGHIVIAVATEEMWRGFCHATGLQHLLGEPRYATVQARRDCRSEVDEIIKSRLLLMTCVDLLPRLEAAGVPCGPINDIGAALEHEHTQARAMVCAMTHPAYGEVRAVSLPLGSELTRCPAHAPPLLGEDSVAVLLDLGYGRAEIDAFIEQRVVA